VLHNFRKNRKHLKFTTFVFANLNYFGIFAPLKNKAVKIRINISKKRAGKLVIFAALIGMAVFFDHYFEKNPVELDQFSNKTGQAATEHGAIYLFSKNSRPENFSAVAQ
jgi:hypothetical protein